MPRFCKKPIVVEAIRWDETQETFNVLLSMGMKSVGFGSHVDHDYIRQLRIKTLEGSMEASLGDWIIKGVKGEFYPCKPDIFEATYDLVADGPASLSDAIKKARGGDPPTPRVAY